MHAHLRSPVLAPGASVRQVQVSMASPSGGSAHYTCLICLANHGQCQGSPGAIRERRSYKGITPIYDDGLPGDVLIFQEKFQCGCNFIGASGTFQRHSLN